MSRQGAAFRIAIVASLFALPGLGRATESLVDSQAPFWEAGSRDNKLSNACSINRFNERAIGQYVVRLHDKKGGAAVLGVAKGTGFNLWDPDKLAVATEDYMFRQDGTSGCEVFVGGRKPQLPGQPPPKAGTPGGPAAAPPAPAAPQPTVPGASPKNGPPT